MLVSETKGKIAFFLSFSVSDWGNKNIKWTAKFLLHKCLICLQRQCFEFL